MAVRHPIWSNRQSRVTDGSRMPADFTAMAVLMLARGDAASSVRMRKRT